MMRTGILNYNYILVTYMISCIYPSVLAWFWLSHISCFRLPTLVNIRIINSPWCLLQETNP